MFLLLFLGVVAYKDMRERRIPLIYMGIGLLYCFCCNIWKLYRGAQILSLIRIWDFLFAGAIVGACFLCRRIRPETIGLGDIWLLLVTALLAGYDRILGIFMMAFLILMGCSVLLLMRGYSKNTTLPFAPFLLIGYVGYLAISAL